MARREFGDRVLFWMKGSDRYGHYEWVEVWDSIDTFATGLMAAKAEPDSVASKSEPMVQYPARSATALEDEATTTQGQVKSESKNVQRFEEVSGKD